MNPEDADSDPENFVESAAGLTPTRWIDSGVTIDGIKSHRADHWNILVSRLGYIAKHSVKTANYQESTHINFEDAEDVTMNLLGKIYEKIDDFKDLDHIEAHFRTEFKNDFKDLIDYLKAKKRGGGKVHSFDDPEIRLDKPPLEELQLQTNEAVEDDAYTSSEYSLKQDSPVSNTEIMETRRIIFACVAKLKPAEQKIINLAYEGKQHKEIAKAVNVKEKDVGTMLKRIYAKLQKLLIKRMGQKGLQDYDIKKNV